MERIDPTTNEVVAEILVPGIPGDGEGLLTAAFGAVWLFTDSVGTLVRIDPKRNRVTQTYNVGGDPVSIVAGGEHLWATEPGHEAVLEIDPSSGTVVREIPVAAGPRFEAADDDSLWVLGQHDGHLTRIDLVTGDVLATIDVESPGEGGCVAAGAGSVWITVFGTPITRVDASTNEVIEQFKGSGGDCISYAAGSVWLSNLEGGTVWRIQP